MLTIEMFRNIAHNTGIKHLFVRLHFINIRNGFICLIEVLSPDTESKMYLQIPSTLLIFLQYFTTPVIYWQLTADSI